MLRRDAGVDGFISDLRTVNNMPPSFGVKYLCSEIISQSLSFPRMVALKALHVVASYQSRTSSPEVGPSHTRHHTLPLSSLCNLLHLNHLLLCSRTPPRRCLRTPASFSKYPRLFPGSTNGFHLRDPPGTTTFPFPCAAILIHDLWLFLIFPSSAIIF